MQATTDEHARDLPRATAVAATRSRSRRPEPAVVQPQRNYERPTPRLHALVRNAYAMAALMPVERRSRVRTLVLQEDGTVLAMAALPGTEPATLLRDLLAPLGFREVPPTHDRAAGGYGMVLQLSEDAGQTRALHSGGAPVQWPLAT